MTHNEVIDGFKKTVDQFYKAPTSAEYKQSAQLHFIGGVLQSALHILPNDKYFELKQWIYTTHGYDSGGCTDGQIAIDEYFGGIT